MKERASDEHWRQALSDLADGRADEGQAEDLSAAWAAQPAVRQHWQALHLIGDTLRSEELARQAQSGEALLAALRKRLAQEPLPAPLPASLPVPSLRARPTSAWLAPLAVAASFVGAALLLPGVGGLLGDRPEVGPVALQAGTAPLLGQTLHGGALSSPSFVQAAGLREAVLDEALVLAPAASGVTSAPGAP